MTQYKDADELLMGGGGAPTASFKELGRMVKGTVVDKASSQQRDITTGVPKVYENGDPMMQIVITLQTDERDPAIEGDEGLRRVFAKSGMIPAIREAVKAAGMERLEIGCSLAIKYESDGEAKNKAFNPPKIYKAWVKPGVKLTGDDSDPF